MVPMCNKKELEIRRIEPLCSLSGTHAYAYVDFQCYCGACLAIIYVYKQVRLKAALALLRGAPRQASVRYVRKLVD